MAITEYTWNPLTDSVIEETDGAGNVLVEYVNEPSAYGPLLSQHKPGEDRHFHFDALGSTRALTDEVGDVTDTFAYDAWGSQIARTGATESPCKWVGRKGYLTGTRTYCDLTYVRARSYTTAQARWSSIDPLGREQSRYRYSKNSPTLWIDPSGKISCNSCPSVAEDPRGNGVCMFQESSHGDWEPVGVWAVSSTVTVAEGSQVSVVIVDKVLCHYERTVRACYKCSPCCFPYAPSDRMARSSSETQRAGRLVDVPDVNMNLATNLRLNLADIVSNPVFRFIIDILDSDIELFSLYAIPEPDLTQLLNRQCQGRQPTSPARPGSDQLFSNSYSCRLYRGTAELERPCGSV